MKAEELMIGDYFFVEKDNLCIRKGTVVEIRGINADDRLEAKNLIGSVHCRPLDPFQFEGGIWLDYLEPIPLTPEILEENGFVYNESPFVQSWEQFGLSLHLGGDGYRINCGQNVAMVIDSVHQLQHALRLCGINKEIVL